MLRVLLPVMVLLGCATQIGKPVAVVITPAPVVRVEAHALDCDTDAECEALTGVAVDDA